jgi:bifunctional DNA-binding transcriptional regulator/antitoxin component of YhaV-PrlF toxin-antitoxin module
MREVELTKLSSKGQLVLPLTLRENMKLEQGTPFAVMGFDDTIVLKRVRMPSAADFEALAGKAAAAARKAGLKEKDIEGIVQRHRSRRA